MKYFFAIVTAAALLSPLHGNAQEDRDSMSEQEREELRQEMQDAREELQAAARKVADLSRELGEGFAFHMQAPDGPLAPRRAMLGVSIEAREGQGVEIRSVTPDSPADKAGLQAGDVITSIDDQNLAEANDPARALVDKLADTEPGTNVTVHFRREGSEQEATVVPERAPLAFQFFGEGGPQAPFPPSALRAPAFFEMMQGWGDLELAPVSPELGEYFDVKKGLLVVHASDEDDFKLRDGDVILGIGDREPQDVRHALRILGSYRPGEHVELHIVRKRREMTLDVEIPEDRMGFEWTPDRRREFVIERREPASAPE